MIHCGDQIYADVPFSPSLDPDHYRHKYLDAWEDCRTAQRFLTELPHYMILDDHEITNNFDRDMANGQQDHESLLRIAMKVYYEFQHKHNPDTPASPRQYHYTFQFGHCQFFVMDTRYWRHSARGQMIDEAQLSSLKAWLTTHADRVKFVVTSVPFVTEVKGANQDKWCDPIYARQREALLDHIWQHHIGKLVFLTGDMHTSCHASLTISKSGRSLLIHELMSSPINQFTPDLALRDVYISPHRTTTQNGLTIDSTITPNTFYGNHSNIMAIEVDGNDIVYRIYRTLRRQRVAKRGRFRL